MLIECWISTSMEEMFVQEDLVFIKGFRHDSQC
jgi:hypothetical protein